MKKIHFNHLTFKNWTSLLMIISLVLILVGSFEIIDFEYKRTNKILASIGFFTQALYFSKMFWYKNYVEWNKLGMNIKINRIISKSIKFDNVKKLEVDNYNFKIIQKCGREKIFEIHNIESNDLEKLLKIIKQNSGI
ncbi:hypothetical protein [Flavobacterium sp. DSP2-3-1]|uniref:hypothetical protein n=1 Tax=Flavobacterium sp. DSP2-3-1 TaxID=2804620 RepID=UPI003CF99FA1